MRGKLFTLAAMFLFRFARIWVCSSSTYVSFTRLRDRVTRFFFVQIYQNGKNIPIDHKLYQTAINYTKWPKIFQMVIKYKNIFHSKALQILPKLGFLVWKQTIWQPCFVTVRYVCTYQGSTTFQESVFDRVASRIRRHMPKSYLYDEINFFVHVIKWEVHGHRYFM
jgi:hypothetical protein